MKFTIEKNQLNNLKTKNFLHPFEHAYCYETKQTLVVGA